MPGNEVGDRVHNFFDQGSLSQDQSHAQLVEGNWHLFNPNLWSGSERQTAGTLNSNSKNYSAQQADIERARGNQFSLGAHGLNFVPSSSKNEFVKNSSQLNSNGYMHSPQIFPPRQNEANFSGVNSEPERRNMTSRGLSVLESQQRNTLQHANSASFGGSEFPLSFNFLSNQQQMGGEPQGRVQSLPQPQSVMNDSQLMQHHLMLKQMQEVQRQQQFQQFEAMQRNAASPMPAFPSQMDGHRSAGNGNPMHNASSYQWHSSPRNVNWMQAGPAPDLQGYSNGPMIPDQGQTMRFMNLIPHQASHSSHSLFGVPVSNSRTANLFPHNVDKPAGTQVAPPGSSFSGNPINSLPQQMSMQDGSNVSGSVSEGKGFFEHGASQGLGNGVNAGGLNQVQSGNLPMSEGGRQNSTGGSELAPEKSVTPSAGLDPTEEKILFGNDVNIWDAFGGSSLAETGVNRLDGTDALNGFSFMQSGTWSALMQSAVAETSSSDAGPEELSGLDSQNSKLQSGNRMPSVLHDNKQMGSQVVINNARTANCFDTSGFPPSFPHQPESQISQERKWLDCNMPNSHAESNHAPQNAIRSQDCSNKTDMGSWGHQRSMFLPQSSSQPSNKLNLNFVESAPENRAVVSSNQVNFHDNFSSRNMSTDRLESVPNFNVKAGSPRVNTMDVAAASSLSNMKVNNEHNLKHPDGSDLDLWKPVNSYVNSKDSDKVVHNSNVGPAVSIPNHGSARLYETGTNNQTDNLNESHRHAALGGLGGNVWTDATSDSLSSPGGQEKLPCQSVKKVTVARKFQYHPMGDVDMDVESSVAQEHEHSQPMSQHFSSVKSHETQTRFFGSLSSNSMDMDQASVSGFQGAVKMTHGVVSTGVHSSCSPNTSATFVRSGEISSTNQHVSSSQNMLQFLNMVDRSSEQNVVTPNNLSDNRLSNTTVHERDGFNQNRSSVSHGFNLQLAPPSQGVASPNFHAGFQSSSRPMDSPKLGQLTSDKEDKNHAWLGSVSSAQCLPPSPLPSLMQSGIDRPDQEKNKYPVRSISRSMDADASQQNLKGKPPAPVASVSPFFRNSHHNQHMTSTSGKTVNDKSAGLFDRGVPHDHQISDSKDLATGVHSVNNAQHNPPSGSYMNQSGLRASMNQVPGPPAATMPDMSRKDNLSQLGANMWISQSHMLGAQGHNVSQTSSSSQVQTDGQNGPRMFDASTSQGAFGRSQPPVSEAQSTGEPADASQEEKPTMENPVAASPWNSRAGQKDVEAFHQSFKSNYVPDNNSFPNEMLAVPSTGTDSTHRELKRLKGSDGGPDTQQATTESSQAASGGLVNAVRDSSVSQPLVSAGNSNTLSFATQSGNRNTTFQYPPGAVGSQNTLFGRNDPQKFIPGNVSRIEYSGISPEMAPPWVNQYGALKNGQMSAPRFPANKDVELQSVGGTSNELVANSSVLPVNRVDTAEIANSCPPTSSFTPGEHVSSLEAVSAPILAPIRQKKRKTATSDLVPWDKEVGQRITRLPSMSLADMNWARSSNRLVEKVEDETDNNDDASLITRPKRRLVLTTQLMQQVFCPPSAGVLSVDASSSYQVILYSLARLALVDACTQICRAEDDAPTHIGSGNPLTEKTSERIRDQYFSKVVEDFINRAKELEDGLVRLDKHASILDIRLDSQDLERFSVINRFARFHGRSQVDGTETSCSSDATAAAQKPGPQRYVSASPMPMSVPERVQCLSL